MCYDVHEGGWACHEWVAIRVRIASNPGAVITGFVVFCIHILAAGYCPPRAACISASVGASPWSRPKCIFTDRDDKAGPNVNYVSNLNEENLRLFSVWFKDANVLVPN